MVGGGGGDGGSEGMIMREEKMKPKEKKKVVSLSVLVLTKNEGKFIGDCLKSVCGWADEVVLADTGSTDETLEIAKRFEIRVFQTLKGGSFCDWRNFILSEAKGDWVFYLDADERATEKLKEEIDQRVGRETYQAYAIPRRNFLLKQEMKHGGWAPDYVKRLFERRKLSGWRGELHEEPVFCGEMGHLREPMIHIQPETLEPMVEKSIKWSKIEAKLLFDAGHPKVVWWRVLRMGLTTFWLRYVCKRGFLDGAGGFIIAAYQAYHTMIVYMQLWEMQNSNQKSRLRSALARQVKVKSPSYAKATEGKQK